LRDHSCVHAPVVVWTIIALNAAAFLYQLSLGQSELQAFLFQHALVPVRYFNPGEAWQVGLSPTNFTPLITNTFLHGGFLHIVLNMGSLLIFGPALEVRLGAVRFAALYLLTGLAGSLTHAVCNASSAMPALGASGAIAGVIAAYAVLFPCAWVRALAGIWFLHQVLQGTSELFSPMPGGDVAWWAHVGGFAFGWAFLLGHGRPAIRYKGEPAGR
jgi:membrane associated rhomboid family serine protease